MNVSDQMFKRSGTEEDEPEVTIFKIQFKELFPKKKTKKTQPPLSQGNEIFFLGYF